MLLRLGLRLLCLFVLAACAQTAVVLPPTATAIRVVSAQQEPERTVHAISRTAASETTEAEAPACLPPERTTHEVDAQLDYAARRVVIEQRVQLGGAQAEIESDLVVFTLDPNRLAEVVTLDAVLLDGAPAPAYELAGRRLTVTRAQAQCAVIDLRYALNVPAIGSGLTGLSGFFGYTERQINLGNWLATVAPHTRSGWVTHDVAQVGEQLVADVADWDVTLTVTQGPETLQLAAPGVVVPVAVPSATSDAVAAWRVALREARDFTVSLSDRFVVAQLPAAYGTRVELYHLGDYPVAAAEALRAAADSLTMFADLFGDYHFERFVVVEGDFPDGMEFTGLVFVSDDWFRTYQNTPASYLTIITVHEAAHQWWYARVGNDQALHPWLDEALATYSELIYYEEFHPELRDWWWATRVRTYVPDNYTGAPVDSDVFAFSAVREYINAVYLRGATMLHAMREDMGTDAFFEWLRRYSEVGRGQVVGPDFLFSLLTPEERDATAATRAAYLGQSG